MNLTAYEWGHSSPADHFPAEERANVLKRDAAPYQPALSPEERASRRALALRVRERYPSTSAMARAMAITDSTVRQWLLDDRPVPDKHIRTLERLAGLEQTRAQASDLNRKAINQHPEIEAEERERRRKVALRAVHKAGTRGALGEAIGSPISTISRWTTGYSAVHDEPLSRLVAYLEEAGA